MMLPLAMAAPTAGWIDISVILLGAVALILVFLQFRKGTSRGGTALASADGALAKGAWVAVGLLFVVAMLNYLDRQLLATMAAPIQRDIPQTNAQFGLLTAIFLFIYSALSPVGGILADRFSRRLVILVSLVIWSAVTWLTGHAETYAELVVARALMGISEAFYIPAALALITDFHRGRTRSLATGIHMSGIYLGQALAGLGGYAAESLGWRMAFGAFGLVGVAYAIVLIVWLREPETDAEGSGNLRPEPEARPRVGEILSGCLKVPAFWAILLIMGAASVSNWFVLSWLPMLLQDKFGLSLGEAGIKATLPSSVAKYAAVIIGGILADRWAARNPAGRAKLAGLAFLVAGPMVALTPLLPGDALALFVGLVAFQGIAQGCLDATLMPILRSHIDGRYAATGYGFLNLIGAGLGGVAVLYGGALKDSGIPLGTTLAASGAGLLACGVALLLLPKPSRSAG